MTPYPEPYQRAIRDVSNQVQRVIFQHETHPLRDRLEAISGLQHKLNDIALAGSDGKDKWRRRLLELAAYAIFAAVADE